MKPLQKNLTDISLLALLAANAVPLAGVILFRWDAFIIVLLYWAENLAVGFYNVLKIAFVKVNNPTEHLSKLFMIPFFIVHYGGFTAVHGFFILAIFSKGEQGPPEMLSGQSWPCVFVFVQLLVNVVSHIILMVPPAVRLAILLLFVSHGISFVHNYFVKCEYAQSSIKRLMTQPYSRVVIMHIAILTGGFFAMILGSPAALLAVLVVLKTAVDVKMHLREHKKTQKTENLQELKKSFATT